MRCLCTCESVYACQDDRDLKHGVRRMCDQVFKIGAQECRTQQMHPGCGVKIIRWELPNVATLKLALW